MLGYAAADVMNKITPADISDPQELIARAKALTKLASSGIPHPCFQLELPSTTTIKTAEGNKTPLRQLATRS
jgi:hypothetical protein